MGNGKKAGEDFGEMLFTHYGLSGPIILSLSKKVSELLAAAPAQEVAIEINLKPALSAETLDSKASALEHGDYMGAILSLGLKRSKIGDIHVHDNGCHAVVAAEIAEYLAMQLSSVGRLPVHTEVLPLSGLKRSPVKLETMELSVASLRLDGISSDVCRLSRAKILPPIKAGRVRVNWKVEEDPSRPLKEGDTVSVQGFGRFRVLEVGDLTKKGRYRVTVGKFV